MTADPDEVILAAAGTAIGVLTVGTVIAWTLRVASRVEARRHARQWEAGRMLPRVREGEA